jgi:hypothetical protein
MDRPDAFRYSLTFAPMTASSALGERQFVILRLSEAVSVVRWHGVSESPPALKSDLSEVKCRSHAGPARPGTDGARLRPREPSRGAPFLLPEEAGRLVLTYPPDTLLAWQRT